MEVLPLQQNNSHAIMEQEHRITYKAGITRSPSDFLCQDGELAECINLTTDNEELKPIVQPAPYIKSAWNAQGTNEIGPVPHFIYIHKFNKVHRYIGWVDDDNENGGALVWGSVVNKKFYQEGYFYQPDGTTLLRYNNGVTVTSIGKVLIFSGLSRLYYYIWKQTDYDSVVFSLPEIRFKALLKGGRLVHENSGSVDGMVKALDSADDLPAAYRQLAVEDGKQDEYNDLVVGLYAKNKKAIASEKAFCEPFFIRAALELYDGTYVFITNPVLLFPSVRMNSYGYVEDDNLCVRTAVSRLFIRQEQDFTDYSDIVKDVVLFASKGVSIYNTDIDQPLSNSTLPSQADLYYADTIDFSGNTIEQSSQCVYRQRLATTYSRLVDDEFREAYAYKILSQREDDDILHDIESTSQFYRICSLGLAPIDEWVDVGEKITDNTLPNLTTQPRLEYDDYFSRNKLTAEVLYPYNSRLNLAGVKRRLFEGFSYFMPLWNNSSISGDGDEYFFYVKIRFDDGKEVWVLHVAKSYQVQGVYFFYPDPRAKHVTIINNTTHKVVLDAELKEHKSLNGSYYMKELPSATTEEVNGTISPDGFHPWPWPLENPTHEADVPNNDYMEDLPNYIVQSEVNNPWVFKAGGYFRVGTGRILGMSTITQALSQGQFGNFPLLVFSESGIWALSVGSDGYYSSIHPMSREVCINPNNIIQTDGAVFFVSKKGLMVIVGSDVRCVSGQMNGETFDYTGKLTQLTPETTLAHDTVWKTLVDCCANTDSFVSYISHKRTQMAYDYTDSRLVIFNQLYSHAYIYNIADGTISKTILPMLSGYATGAVNNYPDYLIQGIVKVKETVVVDGETFEEEVEKERVFSFYEKPGEDEVSERSLAFLLTRPMKLAGPVSQASLRQLKNVGTWLRKDGQGNELSCVKTEIYLSEDMQKWYPDGSRFGAAARYYRLALYIKMLPTERLSGTIITSQERRGENMR